MKIRAIKNNKKHLQFDILIDVFDFSHISFEINIDTGEKLISNINLYSLCYVEYYKQITYFTYDVYLNPTLYSKLLDMCEFEIAEDRPDGDAWQDTSYSQSSYKGNPYAKYYKISNFSYLFSKANCQWCSEAAMFGKAIVIFDEESTCDYINVVYTDKDAGMLLGINEGEDKKKDDYYYDDPEKYSDDWMDNPEDYWNID